MGERRKMDRLFRKAQVRWKKTAAGSAAVRTDLAKDISIGGLCLVVTEPPAAGEELMVEIELPEQKLLLARAAVVRVTELTGPDQSQPKKYNVGVSFVDISDADRAAIEKLIIASYFP